MLDYLLLRGQAGPLFIFANGSPVTRTVFPDMLTVVFKYCGYDPSRYKGQNFRIGAASYAADAGMSDPQIRALGRWKSNAFRIPSLSSLVLIFVFLDINLFCLVMKFSVLIFVSSWNLFMFIFKRRYVTCVG